MTSEEMKNVRATNDRNICGPRVTVEVSTGDYGKPISNSNGTLKYHLEDSSFCIPVGCQRVAADYAARRS